MTQASTQASTTDTITSDRGQVEYSELSRTIRDAGLLQRRYGYYALSLAGALGVFAGLWVLFAAVGDTWWQLAVAAALAVAYTQLSYLGHDAGHKQIFRSKRANDAVGHLNAALVGLSFGWWVAKHNRHHANPNNEDSDPDLDIPILAFTENQSRGRSGLRHWTAGHQAYLFFPLLLLEGFALHWASLDAAFRGDLRRRRLERALVVAHVVVYLVAVFAVLPWPLAVAFIAVHQCLWGLYMGCSFAPNHKGMETMGAGDTTSFMYRQILTSRDVGGRWTGAALGGLNYQIEHHLFPTMPRPNLRRAQPLVEAFCAERGISYTHCSLVRSYADVLLHLHSIGAPLRTPGPTTERDAA